MSNLPYRAKLFIVFVMLLAAGVTVYAMAVRMPLATRPFIVLMATAVIAARLKLTLPGFESNMSMNLPFMLLAVSELTMPEAIAVGAASTFVQTLPRSGQKVKPAQSVFNIGNMVNAIAISSIVAGRAGHLATMNKPFLIACAALAFFLADTIPVAGIIAMTSDTKLIEGWSGIALMTFPYFVLGAGLACIVATGFTVIGWTAVTAMMGIMLGVYRCFQFYFHRVGTAAMTRLMQQAAGD